MNNELLGINRIIFYAYAGFAAIMTLIGLMMLARGKKRGRNWPCTRCHRGA